MDHNNNDANAPLGVTFQVPSELANALRNPNPTSLFPLNSTKLTVLSPLKPSKTNSNGGNVAKLDKNSKEQTSSSPTQEETASNDQLPTTPDVPLLQDDDDWEETLAMPANNDNDVSRKTGLSALLVFYGLHTKSRLGGFFRRGDLSSRLPLL